MTPLQWTLAAAGAVLIVAAGSALVYTIFCLLTGRRTVSGWVKQAGPFVAAVFGLIVGFVVGMMFAHWWFPTVGE